MSKLDVDVQVGRGLLRRRRATSRHVEAPPLAWRVHCFAAEVSTMKHNITTTFGAALIACLASACAADESQVLPAETETTSEALGTCPATTALRVQRQRQASDILAYILGDSSKAPPVGMLSAANAFRSALRAGGLPASLAVVGEGVSTICGLQAGVVRFGANPQGIMGPFATFQMKVILDTLAMGAELTFPGISPFLHTANCATANAACTMDFDPEPAQLGAPLSGSAGATASATYINSGGSVSVRKWPSTFATCSANCPAFGQPCSASNLAAGTTTASVINASSDGTRYRCGAQP
jgi:hypothetical protein